MFPSLDIALKSVRAGNTTEWTLLRAAESLSDDFCYWIEVQVLQETDRIVFNLQHCKLSNQSLIFTYKVIHLFSTREICDLLEVRNFAQQFLYYSLKIHNGFHSKTNPI